MSEPQPLILLPEGRAGRFLTFDLVHDRSVSIDALGALVDAFAGKPVVVGFGAPLVERLGQRLPGLRPFPALAGPAGAPPATQGALLCFLAGDDRGELLHEGRTLSRLLAPAFRLSEAVDTFVYRDSRDLTGYVDGTENPRGQDAIDAALVAGRGAGLDGGSFVAVQRWVHDLETFASFGEREGDAVFGRSRSADEELQDAPESAHVKRTAQEDFDPPAFVLRRSMPFVTGDQAGLMFVAYGESLDRFERLLRRMLGIEDGIADALFRFTRPVSGGYYFCPPLRAGRLDLRALGG